jgi:hypothetical protein
VAPGRDRGPRLSTTKAWMAGTKAFTPISTLSCTENRFGMTAHRSNTLPSPNSRRQPEHHCVVGILAVNCMSLYDSRGKGCGLLPSLSFVTRKQHPFADNFTPHVVLGSHRDFLSRRRGQLATKRSEWFEFSRTAAAILPSQSQRGQKPPGTPGEPPSRKLQHQRAPAVNPTSYFPATAL